MSHKDELVEALGQAVRALTKVIEKCACYKLPDPQENIEALKTALKTYHTCAYDVGEGGDGHEIGTKTGCLGCKAFTPFKDAEKK